MCIVLIINYSLGIMSVYSSGRITTISVRTHALQVLFDFQVAERYLKTCLI